MLWSNSPTRGILHFHIVATIITIRIVNFNLLVMLQQAFAHATFFLVTIVKLWWKTNNNKIWPFLLMEDNLWWKTVFYRIRLVISMSPSQMSSNRFHHFKTFHKNLPDLKSGQYYLNYCWYWVSLLGRSM